MGRKRYDLALHGARIEDYETLFVAATEAARFVSGAAGKDDTLRDRIIETAAKHHDKGGEVTPDLLLGIARKHYVMLRAERDALSAQYDYRRDDMLGLVRALLFADGEARLDGKILDSLETGEARADLVRSLVFLPQIERDAIAEAIMSPPRRSTKRQRALLTSALTRLTALMNSYHGKWVRFRRTASRDQRETRAWDAVGGGGSQDHSKCGAGNPARKAGSTKTPATCISSP